MKKLLIILLTVLVNIGYAQEGPQVLIDLAVSKAKETKLGGSVGLDGKPGTVHYLAIYTIHDADKRDFAEVLNVGWEVRRDAKIAGFLMPLTIDPSWLTSKVLKTSWAQAHVTNSVFPPIFFGVGPTLPLDWELARHWKPFDITAWRIQASVRIGSLVK
jgi:hypothetical protein